MSMPRFITSLARLCDIPSSVKQLPQIALVGRSNAGKSSLLNHFLVCQNLAKTSKIPGKTALINLFEYHGMLFVDLPGYGFAKDLNARKKWSTMISEFLADNPTLKLLLVLLDIRHLPSDDDHAMLHWTKASAIPFYIVLTKADKLNYNEQKIQEEKIKKALGMDSESDFIHYTIRSKKGRDRLRGVIKKWAC